MSTDSFYRRVWRWHFWAGLIACPVLLAIAVTGALYTFREEIEDWHHADVRFAVFAGERRPLGEQLDAARAAHPSWTATRATLPSHPRKSTVVQMTAPDGARLVYVHPSTAEVIGDRDARSPFFAAVLTIHRSLFVGTAGRIAVELATCWSVVLIVTGVYLWLPASWRRVWGVWLPRVWGRPYAVLRDWHTVGGLYLAPVLVILAVTGLFFTVVWVRAVNLTTAGAGQFPRHFLASPPSAASPAPTVSASVAEAAAREHYPDHTLIVVLPAKPADSYVVQARGHSGPSYVGSVGVDRTTGAVLSHKRFAELSAVKKVRMWVLPLHTGTVYGWPTKVLACLACVVVAWLAVSGVWMWLDRRPAGRSGLPRASAAPVPKVAVALILLLGVLFPTVGASIVLVLVGEWAVGRLRRPRTSPPVSVPQEVSS